MSSPENVARICKVLGVEVRVRILQLLKDRVLCVGASSRPARRHSGRCLTALVNPQRCGSCRGQ